MPSYGNEFALERLPLPAPEEIRMRILLPENALTFRRLLGGAATLCALAPGVGDDVLAQRITARGPITNADEVALRIRSIRDDTQSARQIADIVFENGLGVDRSVAELHRTLEAYFDGLA